MDINAQPAVDTQQTTCCIVGGGPAGTLLALLLVRTGIPVTLLEAQRDFDREFRGDGLHISVMEIMDDLGLADGLPRIPHSKVFTITAHTCEGRSSSPTTAP